MTRKKTLNAQRAAALRGAPRADGLLSRRLDQPQASGAEWSWLAPGAWRQFLWTLCDHPDARGVAPDGVLLPVSADLDAPMALAQPHLIDEESLGLRFFWLLRRHPDFLPAWARGSDFAPLIELCLFAPARGLSVAKALLDAGCDPNEMASSGVTPLLAACVCAANFGLSPESPDSIQASALLRSGSLLSLHAPRNADGAATVAMAERLAELLLDRGADPADEMAWRSCEGGFSPLHWAAAQKPSARGVGEHSLAALLIARGAPPNRPSRHQETALHLAAIDAPDRLPFLIASGADSLLFDSAGLSAPALAANLGLADAIDAFCAAGVDLSDPRLGLGPDSRPGGSLLHLAAGSGRKESLRVCLALFSAGCEVDALDANGESALFRALANGSHESLLCAQALLDAGASVSLKNHLGDPPLCSLARASAHRDKGEQNTRIALLLPAFLDPMGSAAQSVWSMKARLLLRFGADLLSLGQQGASALDLALRAENAFDAAPLVFFLSASGCPVATEDGPDPSAPPPIGASRLRLGSSTAGVSFARRFHREAIKHLDDELWVGACDRLWALREASLLRRSLADSRPAALREQGPALEASMESSKGPLRL